MPYKRSYKSKRTNRRKSYKKRPTTLSLSRRLNKLTSAVEYKHVDFSMNAGISNSGYFTSLTDIPQGDGDLQRDGDKVTVTSVQLRLQLHGGDIPYNNIRIIIFKWNNLYQTPTVNDLLLVPSGAGVQPHCWMYNLDAMRARPGFKILMDRTYQNQTANNQNNKKAVNIFKKIPYRTNLQYQAGSLTGNSLYMFAISDSAISNHPVLSGMKRVNFIDI